MSRVEHLKGPEVPKGVSNEIRRSKDLKYWTLITLLFSGTLDAAIHQGSEITRALEISAVVNSVPLRLLKAICFVESRLNPKAINKYDGGSSSYGLCQIKLATSRCVGYRGNVRGLLNPYINASLAGRYLHYQMDRYHGDWVKAISAYNSGSARPVIRNRRYVNKVLTNAVRF